VITNKTRSHVITGSLHGNIRCESVSAEPMRRVLFISSYNPSFPTFFDPIEGIRSALPAQSVILDVEFMDSKRFYEDTDLLRFHASLSNKLTRVPAYDVLMTSDDSALDFALTYQAELFPGMPIVFFGVNDIDVALKQNYNPDVTGIRLSHTYRTFGCGV
jgi:hypothetical protein